MYSIQKKLNEQNILKTRQKLTRSDIKNNQTKTIKISSRKISNNDFKQLLEIQIILSQILNGRKHIRKTQKFFGNTENKTFPLAHLKFSLTNSSSSSTHLNFKMF